MIISGHDAGHGGELGRWLDGRYDWPDDHWQDHCGDPDCERCNESCDVIPDGPDWIKVARRTAFERGWPLPPEIAALA